MAKWRGVRWIVDDVFRQAIQCSAVYAPISNVSPWDIHLDSFCVDLDVLKTRAGFILLDVLSVDGAGESTQSDYEETKLWERYIYIEI